MLKAVLNRKTLLALPGTGSAFWLKSKLTVPPLTLKSVLVT